MYIFKIAPRIKESCLLEITWTVSAPSTLFGQFTWMSWRKFELLEWSQIRISYKRAYFFTILFGSHDGARIPGQEGASLRHRLELCCRGVLGSPPWWMRSFVIVLQRSPAGSVEASCICNKTPVTENDLECRLSLPYAPVSPATVQGAPPRCVIDDEWNERCFKESADRA